MSTPSISALLISTFCVLGSATVHASAVEHRFATKSGAAVSPTCTTTDRPQLADDAERRLRRLGISFNPGRLKDPYDPAGELC